ncbi:DinB superfamily protein [Flavobacterium swingsii]|uniref:DinB superfamily protein n=1 Tax=Flavobacterium swingsii TaxID=498292 RepID=A0A1I0XEG0_9FLAO|nr:putative metal-dependent hydrolase [Flavobacterium swingsii]SFA99415.1 DinB superfamily protein [Flavobacterium swingsii]
MENTQNLETLKFPIGHFTKPDLISEKDIKNWIETIEMFPSKLKNTVSNLSAEELNWKYRPEGWKIKQVIHHCADSHINSFIRFKLALTEDNPTIKPYDESKWAELIDGNCDDISSSLLILEGVHTRWTMLLKSFDTSDLAKTFIHPESKKTYKLKEIIGLYAWHCNHHFAHIEQALMHKGKF